MPENTQGGEQPNETNSSSVVGGIPALEAVEDGTPTQSTQTPTIDWAKFDVTQIPEDVIKGSPAFKQVLEESIQRRKKIAELEKAQQQVVTPQNQDEVPAWAKPLINAVSAIQTERQKTTREKIAEKYGVPADMAGLIAGETDEDFAANVEIISKGLKKSGGVSGNTSSGNPNSDDDVLKGLRNRIRAKAADKGVEADSPFDPGVQITRGGGAVRR